MTTSQPIYHITHLKNLSNILASGGLYSDSKMRSDETPHTLIGHEHIKQRRLSRKVSVAAKGFLGDYVPFNFCPRSVMLYIISVGAVEGYDDVIHLVSTIEMATKVGKPLGLHRPTRRSRVCEIFSTPIRSEGSGLGCYAATAMGWQRKRRHQGEATSRISGESLLPLECSCPGRRQDKHSCAVGKESVSHYRPSN